MWPDNPDWQMTLLFLLALALMGFAMKLIALPLSAKPQPDRPFLSWILVSPDSVARAQPATGVWPELLRLLMLFGAWWLSYWVYGQLVRGFQIQGILRSYLAAPVLLLMMELLVALANLILVPGGWLLPALHRRPWLARSVADFWGNRWNLWFSDWFRSVFFSRLRRRPVLALFLIFAVSGLMHEWVINVPVYHVTGRAFFGTMMIYFLLQPVGIIVERRFLKGHPRLNVALVWLVVAAPGPLIINEGLLRTLHLWPE